MQPRNTLRSLFSIIFLDQTYLTLTFPLITLIFFDVDSRLFESHTSDATRSLWYGCCVALPNIINLFFAPMLSTLSDVFGRKKILLIEIFSAVLFTLSVATGIYFGALAFVFFGFIIKGMFARTNPTALAIIGDTVPKSKKILYMGYLQFAISVGASIGPIAGGYFAKRYAFATLNFALPFLIAASLSAFNTILAYLLMPETLIKRTNQLTYLDHMNAIKTLIRRKEVLQIALILLLIQTSWSMYYQFIPPILKTTYALDSKTLGWFIGMIAFWLAVATGIVIKTLQKFLNMHQMLLVSVNLILLGLGITLFAFNSSSQYQTFWLWFAALPVAFGDVIAYSALTALFSNITEPHDQGKVMGLVLLIVGLVWASTGFLGGLFMSMTTLLPLWIAPIGCIIALVLLLASFGKKVIFAQPIG